MAKGIFHHIRVIPWTSPVDIISHPYLSHYPYKRSLRPCILSMIPSLIFPSISSATHFLSPPPPSPSSTFLFQSVFSPSSPCFIHSRFDRDKRDHLLYEPAPSKAATDAATGHIIPESLPNLLALHILPFRQRTRMRWYPLKNRNEISLTVNLLV